MRTGDVVDGYKLVEYIGDGGMANVWKVEKDGHYYAIKVCKSKDYLDAKRFEREFRLMNAISHPNILTVYEQGECDGQKYFIEELADMNLEQLIEKGISTKMKYMIAQQICEGIEAIHKRGEVHRDIKPKNVLMIGGIVKIADFGIGRFFERVTTTLTMSTDKFGSFEYASPELIERDGGYKAFKDGSPLIDIYAMGGLLYYLFSEGSSPMFFNHNMVSADIFPILSKCREYSPENRYQSAAEVLHAIQGVIASKQRYKSMTSLVQDQNKLSKSELTENALSLLYSSNGEMELLSNFQAFKAVWPIVKRGKPDCADNIGSFIIKTFEDDHDYWLQFQDTEIMARMAVLLCPEIKDPVIKVGLLKLCLTNAIAANRWDAIRDIHENLITRWNEETIKPYASYIKEAEDDFYKYPEIINVRLPQLVKQYLT